jgi:predicted nucleotidyltransferase
LVPRPFGCVLGDEQDWAGSEIGEELGDGSAALSCSEAAGPADDYVDFMDLGRPHDFRDRPAARIHNPQHNVDALFLQLRNLGLQRHDAIALVRGRRLKSRLPAAGQGSLQSNAIKRPSRDSTLSASRRAFSACQDPSVGHKILAYMALLPGVVNIGVPQVAPAKPKEGASRLADAGGRARGQPGGRWVLRASRLRKDLEDQPMDARRRAAIDSRESRRRQSEPRQRVAELAKRLQRHFGKELLGLYLYGSLAAGGFVDGRSDIDLFTVVENDLSEDQVEELRRCHADYVATHPELDERVEVAYVSESVLSTLDGSPAGTLVVVSPGEPLHTKDVDQGWVINWYSVCTNGETLIGPPPLQLGPFVTSDAYKRAIEARLDARRSEVRAPSVAYVPAHQGYVVVTVCRALYGLATGRQTTKDEAVAWVAERFPQWAALVNEALTQHRADVHRRHETVIRFVDQAVEETDRLQF